MEKKNVYKKCIAGNCLRTYMSSWGNADVDGTHDVYTRYEHGVQYDHKYCDHWGSSCLLLRYTKGEINAK